MAIPVPPAGFMPPPGLETRLSSKAVPFQPRFDAPASGFQLIGSPSHIAKYSAVKSNGVAGNLGGFTQQCAQNLSLEADCVAGASKNLQQTLIQLKGALKEWEPCVPESDEQSMQLDTSVQTLKKTLAHLNGSLAELEPHMPTRDGKDIQLDKSTQHLQQTLGQLKGALAAWQPNESKGSEQDECSSQGSRSGKSSSQGSTKSGSTKSGSSKSSSMSKGSSSKSSKSSKSNKSNKKSGKNASVADALDVAIAAASAPVMDAYAYQPALDPTLAMMWGAQNMPFPQPVWQCGWPSPDAGAWPEQKVSMPVSISDSLKNEFRDNSYDLKRIDPSFILMVRKIYRLGLESGAWLKAYFSKYGIVDKVLVGNSRSRANSPACIGFVVMSTAVDVQAILRAGEEHVINGVCITVRPYRRKEEANEEATQEAPSAEMAFQ